MSLADKIRESGVSIKTSFKLRPEILLSPNIPQPMHGLAPRVVLGSKWWNATRRQAYQSTDYHCLACGVWKEVAQYRKWMEGHELYDIDYHKGRMTYIETVPLCHFCHNYIHSGRLEYLLQNGQIHHGKYVAIIQHGDRVLQQSGLGRLTAEQKAYRMQKLLTGKQLVINRVAAWEDWRLVVNGIEYAPINPDSRESLALGWYDAAD